MRYLSTGAYCYPLCWKLFNVHEYQWISGSALASHSVCTAAGVSHEAESLLLGRSIHAMKSIPLVRDPFPLSIYPGRHWCHSHDTMNQVFRFTPKQSKIEQWEGLGTRLGSKIKLKSWVKPDTDNTRQGWYMCTQTIICTLSPPLLKVTIKLWKVVTPKKEAKVTTKCCKCDEDIF